MGDILFKRVDYSLSKLIEDIDLGEIGLPEIQRPFVWANTKVRDLFDSMYKGFPVGYLLFWVNGAEEQHRQIGVSPKQKIPRLMVIDGQQRLTSLYSVIKGIPVKRKNFKEEHIKLAFSPISEAFEVADAAIRRDPEYITDISVFWSQEIDIFDLADGYLEKLRNSREIAPEERKKIRQSIQNLSSLLNYPFVALEVSSSVDEEQAAEVFVRINSKGTALNQADFILTLMSVFWDKGRSELEEFCRAARKPSKGKPSPFNYFIEPDASHLLRVSVALGFRRARLRYAYSILRGKDLETGEFSDELREEQFAALKSAQSYALDLSNWHEFFKVLVSAGYRSGKLITSKTGLLYTYALYLIGKINFRVDPYDLRKTITRWFFMVSLTGRYTDSPETRMEQDLASLRNIGDTESFLALLDRIVTDTFTEDYWNITLPNELATSSSQSPSLFAYYAALNLLDARVLFSNMKVSELLDPVLQSKKASIERHHLFPKGHLAKSGITQMRDTNQIGNYALVEWPDNIGISDKSPAEYFPQYAKRLSSDERDSMRFWHALPEDWEHMEYYQFLAERRKLIAQVIHSGFSKLL